ncbi:MAG TPA: electron transfer flavoprotein subunit alpha/FixB family protein, partial [Candidatus Avipropionibacterium avicola]|nr:electron transfer flavoprotein subunit alpha/FixB family protein [Candidatus Avipropionibacterium avicola]
MSTVLVLVDHHDGAVTTHSTEILTLARHLGEPIAVAFGTRADKVAPTVGEYGVGTVVTVTDPPIDRALTAPLAEALAQIVGRYGAA